jgi:thiamine biosynthesis lipoprotein ApbE
MEITLLPKHSKDAKVQSYLGQDFAEGHTITNIYNPASMLSRRNRKKGRITNDALSSAMNLML